MVVACPKRMSSPAQLEAVGLWLLANFRGRCWLGVDLLRFIDDEMWRYPDARVHDRERNDALAHVEQTTQVARHYLAVLMLDRQRLDEELEFYAGNHAKAPEALHQKFEENEGGIRAQNKFIQSMEEDRQRLALRFENERAQLEPLWRATAVTR